MKRLATGEPAHKHTRIEEPVYEDADKVVGATKVRRGPTFTPVPSKKKKVASSKKKDIRQKTSMQVLGERVERYNFLKSLACAPAGIKFWANSKWGWVQCEEGATENNRKKGEENFSEHRRRR